MANEYYTRSAAFPAGTKAKGSDVVSELDAVLAGFDLIPSPARMASGNTHFVVAAGTGDALTITSPGTAITSYTGADGLAFSIKATATNTGATTLNVDGVGAVALVASDGSDPVAGGITENGIYSVVYNETTGKFVFTDEASSAASAVDAANSVLLAQAEVVNCQTEVTNCQAEVLNAAAEVTLAQAEVVNCQAEVVNAQAEVTNAQAEVANAATEVTYAQEWATQLEDVLISVAAGGDGVSDYSALHWAAKAAIANGIDDALTSLTTTWSSTKIKADIALAKPTTAFLMTYGGI